jgi:Phospholipid methyltransferase
MTPGVASGGWRPEGVGTPFPAEPSSPHLIVGCLYRNVRNPMYPAFVPAIIGQALLLSRPVLLIYAAVLLAAPVAFAHWLEEPTLAGVSASSRRLTAGRCLAGGHACQAEHPDAAPNSLSGHTTERRIFARARL